MRLLGLDISTAITGYAILDGSFNRVAMGHIDFGKCDTFWDKVDLAKASLESLFDKHPVDMFYVEESLAGFTPGMSSIDTILTLAKFNALLSYFVRCKLGKEPNFIAASSARKTCGIQLIQKKKCGITHKEQAFLWATGPGGPLEGVEFPKGRTGKFKPFVGDEVDAYITARAGVILNTPPA